MVMIVIAIPKDMERGSKSVIWAQKLMVKHCSVVIILIITVIIIVVIIIIVIVMTIVS